ncbi:MAG: hypothetical protein V7K89_10340 [Nostoc sp.]|uniref:hypothetical protein n=1 Tax=Nostoc sp. TaxID=1180 RepID=UPI002FF46882
MKSLTALQVVSEELEKFINYLKTVDAELLEQQEVTLLAAVLLEQLPTVLQSNPDPLKYVQQSDYRIKQKMRP